MQILEDKVTDQLLGSLSPAWAGGCGRKGIWIEFLAPGFNPAKFWRAQNGEWGEAFEKWTSQVGSLSVCSVSVLQIKSFKSYWEKKSPHHF